MRHNINNVIIFTTPILDGIKIIEYKGLVTARSVRAINVVRDFFTSFRDLFGGRSGSYQDVMDSMQEEVINELKKRAQEVGANAIIGFQLGYDNIGSKRKSLLMAHTRGTAVVIEVRK